MGKTEFKILIVDDSKPMLRLLEVLLQKEYRVYPFLNAYDAIQWMNANDLDLVISDIGMPYISGLEFVNHIKTSVYFSHIPVLIVSGKEKDEVYSAISPIEIDGVLNKPFDPNELKNAVRSLLTKKIKV